MLRYMNYNYYVSQYSDIKSTFGFDDAAVLQHFVDYGMAEGQQGIGTFNVFSYKNQYPDLRGAFGDNLKLTMCIKWNVGKKKDALASDMRILSLERKQFIKASIILQYTTIIIMWPITQM